MVPRRSRPLIESAGQERTPGTASDRELIAQIRSRDEAGLAVAIELYGGQVKSICLRICVDELEADEVVSLVFWELWHAISKFDPQRGSLRTYLVTLARSRAIDRHRAATARVKNSLKYFDIQRSKLEDIQTCHDGFMASVTGERSAVLHEAIARLPAQQKSALELAFFDGLTHREVAERQSLPLGTIKTNIRRGLIQLRKMMADIAGQERELA